MVDKAKFMVFLRSPVDAQLRELLTGYIAKEGILEFLICSEWDQSGAFVYLKAANFKTDSRWGISIPVSAILSVADFSEANPLGFSHTPNKPTSTQLKK